MNFQVVAIGGNPVGSTAVITNVLENVKPVIAAIPDDRTSWSGQNLVFDTIRVGDSPTVHVQCLADGSQCQGGGKYAAKSGFMYFVVNSGLAFPFIKVNANGANTAIMFTPPKPSTPAAKQKSVPPTPAATLTTPLAEELKNKLAMQAVQ